MLESILSATTTGTTTSLGMAFLYSVIAGALGLVISFTYVYSVSSAPRARSFRTTLTEDENHPHEKCTAT